MLLSRHVSPDAGSCRLAIKAASLCAHTHNVFILARQWNGLLSAFARVGAVAALLREFEDRDPDVDCFSLSIVLRVLLAHDRFDDFEHWARRIVCEFGHLNVADEFVLGSVVEGLVRIGLAREVSFAWRTLPKDCLSHYGVGAAPRPRRRALRRG